MQPSPRPGPIHLALPLMYVAPNRLLAHGYAEVASLDRFEEIRQGAEARGARMTLEYVTANARHDGFTGTFVLDLSSAQVGAQQIARDLQARPGITTLQIGSPRCGLTAAEPGELDVAGTPVVVIARDFVGSTHRRLVESFGHPAEEALYLAGETAGRQAGASVPPLVSQLGSSLTPELIRERFRDLQVFGWATVVSLRVDEQFVGDALLANDFEATAWHGQAGASACHWIRGFIAGALSSLEGHPFEVTEPECQAKGDAYCRMVFRPRV
jgi:predicted hydrocarbon binding protein